MIEAEPHQRLHEETRFWVERAARPGTNIPAWSLRRIAHTAGSIACGVVIGLSAYIAVISLIKFPP